ncbi:hypothetical protein ACLQ3D_24045 [Micromonospora vinacea]|uniref:hypothetical protein n=1 Tax=Micromonospora vinacea TaxID=709878 RepID=UPI003807EC62
MSAFWSGTLSSLLGAVVGGLFSGIAAWLQARTSARSALQQVSLAHQKQLELLQNQTSHQAAYHSTKAIWAVFTAAEDAISRHRSSQDCAKADAAGIPAATAQLEDCDNLYFAHLPQIIQGELQKLLEACSYSSAGWRDMRKRDGGAFSCCGYIKKLEEISQSCLNLTTWFREARVEILSGNRDAPILNQDPYIWLLNLAPPENYEEAVKWRMEEIERDQEFRLRVARQRSELRMRGRKQEATAPGD